MLVSIRGMPWTFTAQETKNFQNILVDMRWNMNWRYGPQTFIPCVLLISPSKNFGPTMIKTECSFWPRIVWLVSFSRALLMISVLTIVVIFLGEAVGITSLFYQQTYYQYPITEMALHVSSHRSTTSLKIFPLK